MKTPDPSRVSLRDIALKLGVGRMTISRALRGLPGVSETLRAKVLREAETQGYTLDPAMSEAMGRFRRSHKLEYRETVAFLTAEPRMRHNTDLLSGAESLAAHLNYKLETFNPHQDGLSGRQVSRILYNRGIRGVIISPFGRARYPHVSLEWKRFAIVLVGSSLANRDLPRVQLDHFGACKLTVRRLQHAGYRRVGLLLEDSFHERSNRQVLAAYNAWRPPAWKSEGSDWVKIVDSPEDWDEVDRWIEQNRLDCLIVPSCGWEDYFARRGSAASKLAWATLETGSFPHITGINTSDAFTKIGTEAMRLVDSHLRAGVMGRQEAPITVLVPARWQEGSTAPPR